MPQETPDSLPRQAYVDIIAYLLKANEFPAGLKELPFEADALKAITIAKKIGEQGCSRASLGPSR